MSEANVMVAAPPVTAPPAAAPPPMVPIHTTPTPIEQEHIKQALDATQTAMSAIDSLLSLSSWVLTVLAVVLAAIAVFGWVVIRNAVLSQSKQIANKRLDTYMKGQEFEALIAKEVDATVRILWQEREVGRLKEDVRSPEDKPAFPEG